LLEWDFVSVCFEGDVIAPLSKSRLEHR
jgi:hypothetical protein